MLALIAALVINPSFAQDDAPSSIKPATTATVGAFLGTDVTVLPNGVIVYLDSANLKSLGVGASTDADFAKGTPRDEFEAMYDSREVMAGWNKKSCLRYGDGADDLYVDINVNGEHDIGSWAAWQGYVFESGEMSESVVWVGMDAFNGVSGTTGQSWMYVYLDGAHVASVYNPWWWKDPEVGLLFERHGAAYDVEVETQHLFNQGRSTATWSLAADGADACP
jgi:hypothetical protein